MNNQTEMTWRKLPRNIIRDENFAYISDCLPANLKAAPYLFYMVALSIADDDGIFDLEDGVIFSRLMHIGTPEDVFTVARLLVKRHIILHAANSTKCMINNWEYSIKDKPRSIEDRRRIVEKKIEQEQVAKKDFTTDFIISPAAEEDVIDVDFSTYDPNGRDFFCAKNDKNQENVVIEKMDDKNEKNVVKKVETEKIREDREIRIDREEHTQEEKIREIRETQGLRANPDGALQPCQEELKRDTAEKAEPQEVTERQSGPVTTDELADQAMQAQTEGLRISDKESRAYECLMLFFAKNCLGFSKNAEQHGEALVALTHRMAYLADDKNPPEIVASVMTSQFKLLTESKGYYQNLPITPENMLKPGAYSHTLAAASKILMSNANQKTWTDTFNKYAQEYEQELKVGNGLDKSYVDLGINPNDPARIMKMLAAHNLVNEDNSA